MLIAAILLSLATFIGAELTCNLDSALIDEIQSYKPVVDKIVQNVINGPRSGVLYNDVADFADTFGARISGSDVLERAIDDVIKRQEAAGLTTSAHSTLIPKWERGDESAEVIEPRLQKLHVIGLGNSASTPPEGIIAQVIVVTSFEELQSKKSEVAGNIVLFNVPFVSYGETVQFRNRGANEASKLGAVGSIVRSITPFSLDTPHTGNSEFESKELRIPAAAITIEGAEFIARLVAKGINVKINLKLINKLYPDSPSRNAIGDIKGATKPEEYVVVSGHIDSWDVGQGVIDDAGGAFLAWHSLALINELGLPRPARTLRAIMWTGEEFGLSGAQAYRKEREDEARNWTVAFESDGGIFPSLGIGFSGTDEATCIMREITSLLGAANGTEVAQESGVGSDIDFFSDLGIPMGEPYRIPTQNYFWYHHTPADWISATNTEDFDQNLAIFASATYILADLSVPLPKTPVTPKKPCHGRK